MKSCTFADHLVESNGNSIHQVLSVLNELLGQARSAWIILQGYAEAISLLGEKK